MSLLHRAQVFVGLVAAGAIGSDEPGLHVKLAMAGAQYWRDPFISKNLAAARLVVEEAADRAFLESLIDGSGDLLGEDTFPKLEPMFTKYPEGSEMLALVEKVADLFGNAVQEVAAGAMAAWAIDDARRKSDDE